MPHAVPPAAFLAAALAAALAAGCGGGSATAPRWIWAEDDPTDERPEVVFVVRDFAIETPVAEARLEILGDEEYWVILNGSPVGAGRYRPGSGWDRYDVTPLLREGDNRLCVELRSARGTGGLLARLTLADSAGERTIASGADWSIGRRHDPRMLEAAGEVPGLEPVHAWGESPLGRWRLGDDGVDLPLTTEIRVTDSGVEPERYRQGARIRGWRRFVRQRRNPQPLGRWVTFDWGREITGYLSLGFARERDDLGTGLMWASLEPTALTVGVDPRVDPYDAVVLAGPGRNWWTDVLPRRFRYLYVLGLEDLALAEVYPVRESQAVPLLASWRRPLGVWGLEPPRLMTPVEDEVWSELQGVPGVAGR